MNCRGIGDGQPKGAGGRSSIWDDAGDGSGRKTAGEGSASRRNPTMAEPFRGVVNVDLEREAAAPILRE
jgi:hypothetical protein